MKKIPQLLIAGTFDRFHVGHQFFIHSASEMCDRLTIIVGREGTITRIKGRAPQHTESDRCARIEKENIPHATVRLGREDGNVWETIREVNPDGILLGYDQRFDEEKGRALFPHMQFLRSESYAPEHFKSSKFQKDWK